MFTAYEAVLYLDSFIYVSCFVLPVSYTLLLFVPSVAVTSIPSWFVFNKQAQRLVVSACPGVIRMFRVVPRDFEIRICSSV